MLSHAVIHLGGHIFDPSSPSLWGSERDGLRKRNSSRLGVGWLSDCERFGSGITIRSMKALGWFHILLHFAILGPLQKRHMTYPRVVFSKKPPGQEMGH